MLLEVVRTEMLREHGSLREALQPVLDSNAEGFVRT